MSSFEAYQAITVPVPPASKGVPTFLQEYNDMYRSSIFGDDYDVLILRKLICHLRVVLGLPVTTSPLSKHNVALVY